MSNYIVFHKPLTPIIDRFKALLKDRDEEMRIVLAKDEVPPPSPNEILRLYGLVLSELNFNSKPLINELTTIAGEQGGEQAEAVAGAICARIIEAPVDQKLPSLYLLDSIVKNIGREYATYFSGCLPQVFCEAYRQVHPNLHPPLRHLFGTWSSVFPYSVLHKIEAQLQFHPSVNRLSSGSSLRASESPRPTRHIHVNPKYLEARRQFESSSADSNSQHAREPSSSLKLPSSSISIATARSSSPFPFGHLSSLSPKLDEFPIDHSPIRVVNRVPPSHSVFGYGTDQGKRTKVNIPPKVENIDSKGMWQNSEEEEFDWEEMNPTLADSTANFRTRPGFETSEPLETNIASGNWSNQGPPMTVNGSSTVFEDAFPSIRSGPGLMNKTNGFRNEATQFPDSRLPQETGNPLNRPESSQQHYNAKESERTFQMSFAAISSPFEQKPPLTDTFQNAEAQFCGSSIDTSRTRSSINSLIHQERASAPLNMNEPLQKTITSGFDSMGSSSARIGQSQNNSFLSLHPHFLRQQSQPQLQMPEEVRKNLAPPVVTPPYSFGPPQNFVYIPQGHFASISNVLSNPVMGAQSSMPILSNPNTALPALPQGPLPVSSNPGPVTPNPPAGGGPGGALSGLISSLVAQGLISLAKPVPMQDSVGLEFDPDLHKVRHEFAITALYTDLPRQCTTCGLRFKSQEEHRSHMDWHVTKNRVSKNPKQKPSRKWFVSASMWLSGAEALGNETVPRFQPTESVVEKKDDEETAVPADEDQTACALCGEPFDDFYSDVTEEWMYKEAVYMNAPTGPIAGVARSRLGPIVHAKCRPESSGRGYTKEEYSQRKRMRS